MSARDLRPVRRRIGIVFQDPGSSLNPRWPSGQSIAEPMLLKSYGAQAIGVLVALVVVLRLLRRRR